MYGSQESLDIGVDVKLLRAAHASVESGARQQDTRSEEQARAVGRERERPDRDKAESLVPTWLFAALVPSLVVLLERVDAALERRAVRTLQFVGASPGAGASTLAAAYALAAARLRDRKVLLLTAAEAGSGYASVLACLSGAVPVERAYRCVDERLAVTALLDTNGTGMSHLQSVLRDRPIWAELGKGFDEVVIDSSYSQPSGLACLVAPSSDGVVLVVEADRTPKDTAIAVANELYSVGANVFGTILNKRIVRNTR